MQAIYYNFVCSFKNNFVIKRFRERKIPTGNSGILKWAKREGLQRAFLLKKWRKNGEKNSKNIERSAGSLVLLQNRYQMNFSQSTAWLFSCPKSPCVRGIYNFAKFSVSLISPRKTVQNLSFSLFSGGQEGNYLLRYIIYKPLILKTVCIMLLF